MIICAPDESFRSHHDVGERAARGGGTGGTITVAVRKDLQSRILSGGGLVEEYTPPKTKPLDPFRRREEAMARVDAGARV
jgi:hypothetical protein